MLNNNLFPNIHPSPACVSLYGSLMLVQGFSKTFKRKKQSHMENILQIVSNFTEGVLPKYEI